MPGARIGAVRDLHRPVIVAWPLDVTCGSSSVSASPAMHRTVEPNPGGCLLALVAFFLIYGLVLSQLVELTK